MKYCCEYDGEESWGDTPQDAYFALTNHLREHEWLEEEIPPPEHCIFYKRVHINVALKMTIVEV